MQLGDGVSIDVAFILNCIQLACYGALLFLASIKIFKAYRQQRPFLRALYIWVLILILVEAGIQGYQVAELSDKRAPQVYIVVIVNVYAMILEALIIFQLSDYWRDSGQILTKQSTESEVEQETHWLRWIMFALFLLCYSAFVAYSAANSRFQNDLIFQTVLALACQGIAVVFALWAIMMQVVAGRELSKTVSQYADWLNSASLKKLQFNCLFWVSTLFNTLRLAFLVVATIYFVFKYDKDDGYEWLGAYVYTFTNVIVVLVYIFGFSTKPAPQSTVVTLLDNQDARSARSDRSRHQTELSSSHPSTPKDVMLP